MAIAEVTICPFGKGTSASKYVAGCERVLQNQDKVKFALNPMGTVMEGDIEDIWKLIREMQESVFNEGIDRVYTIMKIDDRRDKKATMEQKLQSVRNHLEK